MEMRLQYVIRKNLHQIQFRQYHLVRCYLFHRDSEQVRERTLVLAALSDLVLLTMVSYLVLDY